MELTLQIPDQFASRMSDSPVDLSRRAREALALDEFKQGRLTKPELRQLLGFETRFELEDLFKSQDFYEEYTFEDVEREVEALKKLGF
jgi:hypothetical protein